MGGHQGGKRRVSSAPALSSCARTVRGLGTPNRYGEHESGRQGEVRERVRVRDRVRMMATPTGKVRGGQSFEAFEPPWNRATTSVAGASVLNVCVRANGPWLLQPQVIWISIVRASIRSCHLNTNTQIHTHIHTHIPPSTDHCWNPIWNLGNESMRNYFMVRPRVCDSGLSEGACESHYIQRLPLVVDP